MTTTHHTTEATMNETTYRIVRFPMGQFSHLAIGHSDADGIVRYTYASTCGTSHTYRQNATGDEYSGDPANIADALERPTCPKCARTFDHIVAKYSASIVITADAEMRDQLTGGAMVTIQHADGKTRTYRVSLDAHPQRDGSTWFIGSVVYKNGREAKSRVVTIFANDTILKVVR